MVANPLLPLHAAIEVEGHWVESLEPGPRSRIALGRALRAAAHQSFLVGMGYPELSRVETLVATSREAFLH
jgi:hypothetical protein